MAMAVAVCAELFGHRRRNHVLMVGTAGAGKSSLIKCMKLPGEVVTKRLDDDVVVRTMRYEGGRSVTKIVAMDLEEGKNFWHHFRNYYRWCNALVVVVDCSSNDAQLIQSSLETMLSENHAFTVPLLVLANKQDTPNCIVPARLAKLLRLHSIEGRQWSIVGACASTGDGVPQFLDWLAKAPEHAKFPGHQDAGLRVRLASKLHSLTRYTIGFGCDDAVVTCCSGASSAAMTEASTDLNACRRCHSDGHSDSERRIAVDGWPPG